MKVLMLTDDQWQALRSGAPWSEIEDDRRLRLPAAKELHRMARNGETPELFAMTRDRVDAADVAASDLRRRLNDLIVEADELGIKTGVLERWTGLSARRIHQIKVARQARAAR